MPKRDFTRKAVRRPRKDEREWRELLAYGRRRARAAGIRTAEDIERLIHQTRRSG